MIGGSSVGSDICYANFRYAYVYSLEIMIHIILLSCNAVSSTCYTDLWKVLVSAMLFMYTFIL